MSLSPALISNQAQTGWSPARADPYLARSPLILFPLILPMLLAGFSWLAGGFPILTDMAFLSMGVVVFIYLVMEFVAFPRRFGIGALVLFGGYLVWFCYDYYRNWLGRDFSNCPYPPVTIAKAAYFHALFLWCATAGLMLPTWRGLVRILHVVPEPRSTNFYFWLILIGTCIGLSPYFLFAVDPFYVAIWKDMTSARWGGAGFTIGRSGGALNYSWGGYLSQVMNVGQVSAQLAIFYALLVSKNLLVRIICVLIWLIWLGLAFGSSVRGTVAFMMLPLAAILFLKYQSIAAMHLRKVSWRGYLVAGCVVAVMWVVVQVQANYRTLGYSEVSFSGINVLELKGNTMFSEGLPGWQVVPDVVPFWYNRFPGEALVRPMPETLFWFVVKIIPRAAWPNKPVPADEIWYSDLATGGLNQATVSTGLVGDWYFKYGWLGVVQGALLFGWLARGTERGLQFAQGRPMAIVLSVGLAVWLFRCFRNFWFHDLYPLIIGAIVLWAFIRLSNLISGPPATPHQAARP